MRIVLVYQRYLDGSEDSLRSTRGSFMAVRIVRGITKVAVWQ